MNFSLNKQEFEQLLAVLKEAPYQKVAHLIQKIEQQADSKDSIDKTIPTPKIAAQVLDIGERVKARWKGGSTWFHGTIRDFNNGQYFIKYDDGDEEWTTINFIQSLNKPGNPDAQNHNNQVFNIGDRVQVRWLGGETWYDGTIREIKNEEFFIKYDDGDEEWTTVDMIIRL